MVSGRAYVDELVEMRLVERVVIWADNEVSAGSMDGDSAFEGVEARPSTVSRAERRSENDAMADDVDGDASRGR